MGVAATLASCSLPERSDAYANHTGQDPDHIQRVEVTFNVSRPTNLSHLKDCNALAGVVMIRYNRIWTPGRPLGT